MNREPVPVTILVVTVQYYTRMQRYCSNIAPVCIDRKLPAIDQEYCNQISGDWQRFLSNHEIFDRVRKTALSSPLMCRRNRTSIQLSSNLDLKPIFSERRIHLRLSCEDEHRAMKIPSCVDCESSQRTAATYSNDHKLCRVDFHYQTLLLKIQQKHCLSDHVKLIR